MGIEFIDALKPGPEYVGTLLSAMGEDVRLVEVTDSVDGSVDEFRGDWRAKVPVYILNKEVRSWDKVQLYEGGKALVIRV